MSDGELCVGVCVIDWDAGVCTGCGRTVAEIEGTTEAPSAAGAVDAAAAGVTDPPPVAADRAANQAGEGDA